MQRSTVSPEMLGRLAGVRTGGHPVLSLYLDLDPAHAPHIADRRTELDSLLREALAAAEGERSKQVAVEVERVRRYLRDERLAVDGARGLAVFSCEPAHLFEAMGLAHPVRQAVHVGERPMIEPLLEMVCAERWCVLLASSRASRIFVGCRDCLVETEDLIDDVHRRHSQGGWSQARFQRGIEKEIDDHVRQTCERLFERSKRERLDHLAIGGPPELRPRVERALHPDLRPRLAGSFEIDVERATAEEVYRAALPVIERWENERERELLSLLAEGVAPDGHASSGLQETLDLLHEGRVQTLLVAGGFSAPGLSCPTCGRLSADGGTCPVDGSPLDAHANVVERAIESALAQSAEVRVIRAHAEELRRQGSIAALLRY